MLGCRVRRKAAVGAEAIKRCVMQAAPYLESPPAKPHHSTGRWNLLPTPRSLPVLYTKMLDFEMLAADTDATATT